MAGREKENGAGPAEQQAGARLRTVDSVISLLCQPRNGESGNEVTDKTLF